MLGHTTAGVPWLTCGSQPTRRAADLAMVSQPCAPAGGAPPLPIDQSSNRLEWAEQGSNLRPWD